MSKLNTKQKPAYTENSVGTTVRKITVHQELIRAVSACMLWEDTFYLDGSLAADKIRELVAESDPEFVAALASLVRSSMNIRHTPLLMLVELAKLGRLKARHVYEVISRPDELAEILAIYWKDGKSPLSNQLKRGIADAFTKFSAYQFSKYKGENKNISLRDVMFLVHPKPLSAQQAVVFEKLANSTLQAPDTWEVALSSGEDKYSTFVRLLQSNGLGALAFLRNLRNMQNAGVPLQLVAEYANRVDLSKVLPYRLLAAAKHVIDPLWKDVVYSMFHRAGLSQARLPGHTVIVVDASGSMNEGISAQSGLTRWDAAMALSLTALVRCEKATVYLTAGSDYRREHATQRLVDLPGNISGIVAQMEHTAPELGGGGIFLIQCMDYVKQDLQDLPVDRVIVITDEQDTGGRGFDPAKAVRLAPRGHNYILNVGTYANGINSNKWFTISGVSAAAVDFIHLHEYNTLMEKVEKLCLENLAKHR